MTNPHIVKGRYQSFIRKKNRKSVKQSKIITYQPKPFENSNIVDIKSVLTQHPKSSHKLSNNIRQAAKLGSNSSLYNDTKKANNVLKRKKCKNNKTSTCF